MAAIGPVELKIAVKGTSASVDVVYEIAFDSFDQNSNQSYVEVCRVIGDDTATGDVPGEDTTIGFLTPMFVTDTRSDGKPTLKRTWKKAFRVSDLDEDRGTNVDEIRALVTLTPVLPAATKRESNLVAKKF